jgi:predicted regulator of Ras-like GTPase activity (Roadblock/LC7/MglB family)
MSSSLRPVLETLTRQRGVRASLVVSEKDGLVIDSSLRFGQDGERVAALAASVYRKARLSAKAARLGAVTFLQLDAERGRICVAGGGGEGAGNDLVIVTVADPTANVGLIRMELFKALELIA